MNFDSCNGLVRPCRLSTQTRAFAYDSLHWKYGQDAMKTPFVSLDDVEGYDALSRLERYDLAVARIAAGAPLRICDGERISGAATLGSAISHLVPAFRDGRAVESSISHLTVDFETVLRKGISFLRRQAEESLIRYRGTEREPFVRSCLHCLDAFSFWHRRYLEALADRPEYCENYENLKKVPFAPAETFYEAVQSLWFTFAFLRLCGNWPGIGRIDWLLGKYLKADLAAGRITLDQAREILAHFFIKGCEWVRGEEVGSGDAQHYQNILLSGIGPDGRDVTNEVTYLVLDILEELGISDFPTTVRVNRNTDARLLRRVAEVLRYGGGILAIYNEETVLEALSKAGYREEEARCFANDGCWEVQIPGKTFFTYKPFDSLQILQKQTLGSYEAECDFPDFESLYRQYTKDLELKLQEILSPLIGIFDEQAAACGRWKWKSRAPCTVVSLFEQGCLEHGLSYLEGGPVYNVISPHIGGVADTVNSLYAIKKLVYDEQRVSLSALLEILRSDWEGQEELRQHALRRYSYYGNDSEEVDALAVRLLSDFSRLCLRLEGRCGYRMPAGVSTFGRQLEWAPKRLATPYGKRRCQVLAANCSPTPGTDREGATAIIRSYCKIDHSLLATGSALDLKLLPSSVRGEVGLQTLVGLLRGFVALGGFFLQPDVLDASVLRRAQEHPEDYATLSVRISGWNARFVTLNREWQDMVIAQYESWF